ncbi:centromere-associated protein E [Pteronotus mesoamericanus]|uniref:centromere-associated protein E n=1 Tax=Pteronotus mesoamericanus TaxID=1884717 RepID=UPI0023EC78B0|nr:centromere-associated protein E [Pteronotus parnellii mesoamericanus]
MAEEGAVAVCVRVRPLNSREEALGEATQVYWKTGNNTVYQVDGSKSFNFDRVFHSNETTKNVYEEIAVPIIDSAIQGYNGTIFAYGQTASGKTYTMMGSEDYLGVIPRAIHDIFQKIEKFPDREFLLRVSYMEIYNETITDLLCDTRKMKPLIIREDFNRNVYVSDLTEEVVYTSEMALKWIRKGEKNRHYGITKMNQRSSRSHTIFRMILESREKGEPSNCEGSVKVSHLNLVDLAGSERAAQTGAEGMRLKEGCNINRSLFILGQVIKKLSDGQVGGFINYRDSKLTRILQNSLGGNAKTRIICTITPVSFDETLSTLQFASTAKYMKNTPYVNEVSSDEALLKRYRKEIMDLKKQLEEVSLETRAQAMEKDQLAQLLEEKDLLQKVQIEKIQNLTRMLVTSSSLTSQQELKAKIKRRVTWCPGKINKMKDSNYINEFNMRTNTTKSLKTSVTLVGEIDESVCSEADVFSNTLDTVTDIEWNPATKLLSQENLESELNSLRADYDNLVLDYERLRKENEEMELKLKEKNDLDEFEALERKAEKDQEMQLIHEISNLKNLVKHAEVYNQDLENELSSKVDLLKEKEDQIKKLQEYIDSQKSESMKMDLSYTSEDTEDLKQRKQTLLDAEAVALDAKRESAFLRSENLELKEKMKELESICKQMENDNQLYQSRLEAKKKIQIDLEKELQSSFNEITRLTSLIDGKVPKDLLCNLELERKITDLQKELKKEVEINEGLHQKINLLSELTSLPSEVEMLRKEVNDKSEELYLITSEKDKLCSELIHKESRIQDLLDEIKKAKDDLASTQFNYKSIDQEFQDFKNCHFEFEQKYNMVLEENARINREIENLSKHRTQELQQSQERLNEVEELKEQLESGVSRLQTVEREKTLITEKLQQTLEEVRTLTLERDAIRQLQESLQIERDQLKSDIEDTVHMNIDTQEQLRDALESLKQHQETINTLKMKISEENSNNLHIEDNVGETKDEFQEEIQEPQDIQEQSFNKKEKDNETKEIISEMEQLKEQLKAKESALLRLEMEKLKLSERLQEKHEEMKSIAKERDDLQRLQEVLQSKNDQLKENMEEIVAKHLETKEELKVAHCRLEEQEETIDKLRVNLSERETELSSFQKELGITNDGLQKEMQELHEKQEQFICIKEISETQEKMSELEQLKEQLKAQDLSLESIENERLQLSKRLQESQEEIKIIIKERDELKRMQEALQMERDQLKENNKEIVAEGQKLKEELKTTYIILKEYQETINTRDTAEKTDQGANIQRDLENSDTELWGKIQEFQEKEHQLLEMKAVNETQEKMYEMEYLKKQLETQKSTLENLEMENTRLTQRLHNNLEEMRCLTKERDDLRSVEETLKVERDQLKENLRETVIRDLEKQEELRIVHIDLKEHQEIIDELRRIISEKTDEISNMQMDLENKNSALKAQSQELTEKEHQFLKVKNDLRENTYQTEQLKKQLEAQNSILESIETEKLRLTKQLHENLEEVKCVTEERDSLRRVEGTLKMEGDQLRESLRETEAKIQELKANEHQFLKLKEEVSETQKKMSEMEQLKKQIKAQSLTLDKIEMENLNLAQKLHENLEEMKSVMKERDNLRRVEEILKLERDELRANLQETIARDLATQQELKMAHMHLKEHQETIDKFRERVSEKTTEISNMKKDLNTSKDDLQRKIQELQKKELQLLKMKESINKTHKKMNEMEQLKMQFEAQILSMQSVEMDNSYLTKKLHESLEEIRIVAKERDKLRRMKESLKMERDQFRETLRKMIARQDQPNGKEVLKYEKKLLCDGKEHLTESLREKCLQIKELLKRYSEMDSHYEFLHRLSLDLEKETETQKELSVKIKANLSLPYPQTKQIQKLLTVNQRCSMEFYRVMKNLKYVLSNVIMIKKEQHESINKFEMVFIDEVKKQNELLVQLQHFPQDYDVSSRELRDLKLSQKVDLHIEEILKDFSESDFHSIKSEFQQVLSNRRKMTQFLEKWLDTRFDIEELKSGVQEENDRIFQVNKFYNNRIVAIVNESTEFEKRNASLAKEWEHDLKSMKEENEKLLKSYQTLKISQIPDVLTIPTTQDDKNLHVTSTAKQQTTDKIQELETLLHEAKERSMHKEGKIIKMQKELEMTNDVIAKLQDQVNESHKCLEKSKEMTQVLQDKVALGAKPYKEEIEDLKMKLVKIDLEKMKITKEFEKEIASTKATIEYQKEVIRVLRENLRRNQQAQDTSMVLEDNDSQPSNKPLTCGGGSGIVQSTKALILKSEYARLKKEICKLKQQNEQLIKQNNELSSNNHHLSSEVLKEVTCENSPKSPKVTRTASEKRQRTPSQCKERNLQDPVPKESPKSWFFDSRSKSFPSPHPVRYFDNSGLGLCPEEPPPGAENVDPQSSACQAFSEKDLPECKIQ